MSEQYKPTHPPADPLIDEVRAIRKEISDEFDNDAVKLCEHLRQIERQYAARIVNHGHRVSDDTSQ